MRPVALIVFTSFCNGIASALAVVVALWLIQSQQPASIPFSHEDLPVPPLMAHREPSVSLDSPANPPIAQDPRPEEAIPQNSPAPTVDLADPPATPDGHTPIASPTSSDLAVTSDPAVADTPADATNAPDAPAPSTDAPAVAQTGTTDEMAMFPYTQADLDEELAELEKIGASDEEMRLFRTRGFALTQLIEQLKGYDEKIQQLVGNELAAARRRLYQRRREDTLRDAQDMQASMVAVIDLVERRRDQAPFPTADILAAAQAAQVQEDPDGLKQIGQDMDAISDSFATFTQRFAQKIAERKKREQGQADPSPDGVGHP